MIFNMNNNALIRFIRNKEDVFFFLLRYFTTRVFFPLRFLMYEKISINSYISIRSSIRNRKNIIFNKGVQINDFVTIWPTSLSVGIKTQLNPGTVIYGNVKIGNYVMIAPNCMIAGGNHNFMNIHEPMMFQGANEKGIIIEDNVWIGANSVILDGVVIGQGSVVGANSLVSKSLPPFSIAVGNPAKIIRHRS